jgi:hypothetical protein
VEACIVEQAIDSIGNACSIARVSAVLEDFVPFDASTAVLNVTRFGFVSTSE